MGFIGDMLFALVVPGVDKLRKDAENGDVLAQTTLAHRYYCGKGVAENKEEGVLWYRKAAAQGDEEAQSFLMDFGYMNKGKIKLKYEKIAGTIYSSIEEYANYFIKNELPKLAGKDINKTVFYSEWIRLMFWCLKCSDVKYDKILLMRAVIKKHVESLHQSPEKQDNEARAILARFNEYDSHLKSPSSSSSLFNAIVARLQGGDTPVWATEFRLSLFLSQYLPSVQCENKKIFTNFSQKYDLIE